MPERTLNLGCRLKVLGILVLVFGVVHAYLWSGDAVLKYQLDCWMVFWPSALVLMLTAPFLAARWKPHLAGFDTTFWPARRSDYLWPIPLLLVVFIFALCAGLFAVWMGAPAPDSEQHPLDTVNGYPFGLHLIYAVFIIVLAPIVEEIFWRGYTQEQFAKVFPAVLAVFLQAALFVLVHFRPILSSIPVFGLGAVTGLWRLKKRSLLPIIILHCLFNACIGGPRLYGRLVQAYNEKPTMRAVCATKSLKVMRTDSYEDDLDYQVVVGSRKFPILNLYGKNGRLKQAALDIDDNVTVVSALSRHTEKESYAMCFLVLDRPGGGLRLSLWDIDLDGQWDIKKVPDEVSIWLDDKWFPVDTMQDVRLERPIAEKDGQKYQWDGNRWVPVPPENPIRP